MFRVRVLRRGQSDLAEIAHYLHAEAPAQAQRVVEMLLDAMENLAHLPRRGSRPRDERLRALGFRFLTVRSWLVFYKVRGKEVRIYRVLHGRREYRGLL
jgi:addiction module RelE/StbE family toxin